MWEVWGKVCIFAAESPHMKTCNTPADTQGCILVGENRLKGQVLDSRRTLSLLKRRLAQRPEGEAVWITIIDD